MSRRTIGELESGLRGAYPSTVGKLARALEAKPRLLIDGPGYGPGHGADAGGAGGDPD